MSYVLINMFRFSSRQYFPVTARLFSSGTEKPLSPKMKEFKKKLREKTPLGKLDEQPFEHPAQEKQPLPPWPNNTNPHTGEINGPRGPEPTRYGDWERKGRVSDF